MSLPSVRSNMPRGRHYTAPASGAKDFGESDRTRVKSPRTPRDLGERTVAACVKAGFGVSPSCTITRCEYYAYLGLAIPA